MEPLTLASFPRAIVHIDGDAFFASCEQSRRPKLQGRPVVTGKERGIAASMSYEAKARGVTRGMRIADIRKVCPDAVILPSDYETYSLLSKRFFAIVRRYTPDVEEYSIDECLGAALGRAVMQLGSCQGEGGHPVLTQPKPQDDPWGGHEKSLLGTQARHAGESPLQDVHVADVHYGEPVIGESEYPLKVETCPTIGAFVGGWRGDGSPSLHLTRSIPVTNGARRAMEGPIVYEPSRYDPRSMTSYRSTDPSNPVDKSSASLARPRVRKDTYGGWVQYSTSNAGTLVSSACGWWVDH